MRMAKLSCKFTPPFECFLPERLSVASNSHISLLKCNFHFIYFQSWIFPQSKSISSSQANKWTFLTSFAYISCTSYVTKKIFIIFHICLIKAFLLNHC